jgi:hypothetical protein
LFEGQEESIMKYEVYHTVGKAVIAQFMHGFDANLFIIAMKNNSASYGRDLVVRHIVK